MLLFLEFTDLPETEGFFYFSWNYVEFDKILQDALLNSPFD